MKTLPLTQGKVARVDDDVYEWAKGFNWCAAKCGHTFYACRAISLATKPVTQRTSFLHREIMRPGDGFEIHHINGDGLDNQRCNLRVVTSQQNKQGYRRKRIGVTSKYRGVHWEKRTRSWRADIGLNKIYTTLGRFDNQKDAARAYNEAAKRLFGEFAHLNKV